MDELNTEAGVLLEADIARAQALSQEALNIATAIGYRSGEATSRIRLAWSAYLHGDIRAALVHSTLAEQIASEIKQMHIVCNALHMTAIVHDVVGNYSEAFELRLRMLEIARTQQLSEMEFKCLGSIGWQYERLGKYAQAIEAYEKALVLSEALQSTHTPFCRNNLATVHARLNSPELGIRLSEQALSECPAENLRFQAHIRHTLGLAYAKTGQLEQALRQYGMGLQLYDASDGKIGLELKVEVLIDAAAMHIEQSAIKTAHRMLQQALDLSIQLQSKSLQVMAHGALSKVYKLQRNFEQALKHSEQAEAIDLASLNDGTGQRLSALQVTHEIREAQHESELSELKAHKLEQMAREKTQAIEQTQAEMVDRLAATIALRHAEDSLHIERVSQISAALGRALGLSAEVGQWLRQASRLHDIGNITLPDRLISKTKRHTGREKYMLRLHTIAGANLLHGSPSPAMQMAEEIARTHHEQWNGKGYPYRLAGKDIPISGRIVAVAHAFEQIAFRRQHPLTTAEALAEIRAGSGTLFDPQIVQALEEIIPTLMSQLPHTTDTMSSTLLFAPSL